MPVNQCRMCNRPFLGGPLLRYENMPGAAQHLPDAAALAGEKGTDLELFQCPGCGLVQLNRDPVPYYREVIRASAFSPEMKAFRMEQFRAFVRDHALAGKKVVEIGCGRGEYLELIREAGADACGVEAAPAAVEACVRRGLRVECGFVENAACRLEHAPFAAFFLLNFLEHLPDPNGTLAGIGANLAGGAAGLVEVPNFDMILRRRLFSELIGDHLFYFTRETLAFALQMNGFEVVECREVWHDYILSAVVKKRPVTDLAAFRARRTELTAELDAWLRRFADRRVAVWGAGHQALAVLALAGLGGRIRYVVDSAPFKQGKYTPATHIPIVSPDALAADPVDAVIVMAAAYSDEVVRMLRQRFDGRLAVAVLRDSGLEPA